MFRNIEALIMFHALLNLFKSKSNKTIKTFLGLNSKKNLKHWDYKLLIQ